MTSRSILQPGLKRSELPEVNILLVDDKPERLLTYEAALESLGHNLVRALSGREALGLLMKMEFAAILLDVSMPEMDGFETASLIRTHPRFEETPIVFVTGVQVTDLDQLRGYEIGAVDYVQIPVIPSILRGKVHALVQLYLHRAELSRLNRELALTNKQLEQAHESLKLEKMVELEHLNKNLEATNNELQSTNETLTLEIQERKRMEQALSESSQRKDEYIAILAHELRNPLSSIHNATEVLQLPSLTDEQMSWAKTLLKRQIKHLTFLIDDLLDVSRITSGRIKLRLQTLSVKDIVENAIETLKPLLDKHGHALVVNLPDDDMYIRGDLVRLTQVLDNLLTNAIKYTQDGSEIHLNVDQDTKARVSIAVKDQGVGISPDLLDKVFDLFVQAPSAENRAQGGLGIGLALVKALVELHHGAISVASEGIGHGAQFTVHLPVLKDCEAVSTKSKSDTLVKTAPTLSPCRIVIVDDNVDSSEALALYLESLLCDVRICHTGEDGIEETKAFCPSYVLLDIGLPGLSGYEVAKVLRESKQSEDLTIIAMSGFSKNNELSEGAESHFDHYFVKPVNLQELVVFLQQHQHKAKNAPIAEIG